MIRNGVELHVRRLLALLVVALLATSASVALTATPAHAALAYQGTFIIRLDGEESCAQVQNNGTTDKTPIHLAPCDGSNAQRWAIFYDTAKERYWILAYGGAQPLNKCMDRGDNPKHMWIYGCHGGPQQTRWDLAPSTQLPQTIYFTADDGYACVGVTNTPIRNLALGTCQIRYWRLIPA